MDGELTAIPSSTVEVAVGEGSNTQTYGSYRTIIEDAFPAYLAMGMTYDEYYKKDHTLVIAYRKAYERKQREKNQDYWLMGAYVYQAISRAAPLLIPFNKRPKAEPYLDKPFPLFDDAGSENAKNKAVADKGFAYMQAQMLKINAKFGKE